jgi:hypothetical protein
VVGLNSAKVLIVDDAEDEVLDLVRVLWKIGVAPLYVDPATLEKGALAQPLSGIRLAFLDMDIVGAGVDPKSKVAALANCLRRVIHKNNGPYIAVAWTKHPELVEELDSYIFPIADIARPSAFVTMAKEECKDVGTLSQRIDAELQKQCPVRMLQAWEESSAAASSEVVGELAAIASGKENGPKEWREGWQKAMLRIMYVCGREYAGESGMADGPAAFKAFCHSLIPLHGDRLESRLAIPNPALAEISKELLSDDSQMDCGTEAKARINTMLHCSFDGLGRPQPGSVYSLKSASLSSLFPDAAAMIAPLLSKGKSSDEEFRRHAEEISAEVVPIAIETSPSCDHAQGNIIVARLLGGFLVPMETTKKFKSTLPQSFWRLAPVWFSVCGAEKAYALLVNCLVVSSCGLDALAKQAAMFRIRSQAFATLQVCFGSHAARPGMLLLR